MIFIKYLTKSIIQGLKTANSTQIFIQTIQTLPFYQAHQYKQFADFKTRKDKANYVKMKKDHFLDPLQNKKKILQISGRNSRRKLPQFQEMYEEYHQQKLPEVHNIASFAKMDNEFKLDLNTMVQTIQSARYNKKKFPAAIVRNAFLKTTFLVFPNGKVIGMGSKKKEDAEQGFKRLINFIGKALNMRVHMIEFKITNIVANAHLGYKVNLDRLCQQDNAFRNKKFKSAVVLKEIDQIKSALIFSSGKIMLVGAVSKDAVDRAFAELKYKMLYFKK